jgi:hypothetical protein
LEQPTIDNAQKTLRFGPEVNEPLGKWNGLFALIANDGIEMWRLNLTRNRVAGGTSK